jgi:glycosyltransferase involved in cell wall biosynthesis
MIWIDVTDLQSWNGHMTGIQRLVFNIAKNYEENSNEIKYFYYDHNSRKFYGTSIDFDIWVNNRIQNPSITQANLKETIQKYVPSKLIHHTPTIIKKATKKSIRTLRSSRDRLLTVSKYKNLGTKSPLIFNHKDVLLVLGNSWNNKYMFYDLGIKKSGEKFKLVNVVYDLIPVLQPQFFGNLLVTQYTEYLFEAIDNSDLLLPISKSTDNDLTSFCKIVGLPKPTTKVIRLGDELSNLTDLKQSSWYKNKPFILSVGTVEVRKNHTLLYYAYKYLLEKMPLKDVPELVIVGSSGWYTSDTIMLFKNDPVVSKYVRILHKTNDQELAWLYNNALMTVYPSMYEGWGLPVAESLGYGKVTLSSKSSSMPEVGGELVDYFSPYDPIGCANLIEKYLDNDIRRKKEQIIKSKYITTRWKDTYYQVKQAITESNLSK